MQSNKLSKLSIFLLIFCISFFAGILLLPTLASTSWGKSSLVGLINTQISGSVEITSLRLSWFKDQSIEGLKLFDQKNTLTISCDHVVSNSALWKFLLPVPQIGLTRLDKPFLHLIQNQSGNTNLQQIFAQSTNQYAKLQIQHAGTPAFSHLFAFLWERAKASINDFDFYAGTLEFSQGKLFLERADIQAHFKQMNGSLTINPLGQPTAFSLQSLVDYENLTGQIEIEGGGENALSTPFTLKGLFTIDHSKDFSPTTVNAKGNVQWPQQSQMNSIPLKATLEATLTNLSTAILSHAFFSQTDRQWLTLIGSSIDLKGKLSYFGDEDKTAFDISLSGKQAQVKANGYIDKKGIYLKDPLEAEIQTNAEVSQLLLKEIYPLLSYAVASQDPLKLVIEPQEFLIPINPFDVKKLNIQSATLYPGKILLANTGNLKLLLNLLQVKQISNLQNIAVWFTPIRFSFSEGIATFERTDGLVENSIVISSWGKVNTLTDQMDMVLGLPASSLKQAFGLDHLPADYLLQIPLKGSINQPSVDWKKAAAQIAKLLTFDKTSSNSFFSKILNLFTDEKHSKEPPAPQPSRYPWEDPSFDN